MVQENQSATFAESEFFNILYYEATRHVHVAPSETVITTDILISHISYLGRRHFLSFFLESELFPCPNLIPNLALSTLLLLHWLHEYLATATDSYIKETRESEHRLTPNSDGVSPEPITASQLRMWICPTTESPPELPCPTAETVPSALEPACKEDWRVSEPKWKSCVFAQLQQ